MRAFEGQGVCVHKCTRIGHTGNHYKAVLQVAADLCSVYGIGVGCCHQVRVGGFGLQQPRCAAVSGNLTG